MRAGYTRRAAAESVFTTDDPTGRGWRQEVNPVMHGRAISGLEPAVSACTRRALDRWGSGAEVEARPEMEWIARRAVIEATVGPDSEHETEVLDRGLLARRRTLDRALYSRVAIPARLPLAASPSRRSAMEAFDRLVDELVERRSGSPADAGNLLSLLLAPRGEGGAGMTPERTRDEVRSLTINGYRSVTRALVWTLYAAAKDREVQERIRADARAGNGWRTLRYTRMAVFESMRLFPPEPAFLKVARAPDRLPTGTTVRAGANVVLSPYVIQRDASLYPSPERFSPERFGEERDRDRPRFAYFPFGGGPRVCLGQMFATMECVSVVGAILSRYELRVVPGTDGPATAGLGLDPPRGLRLLARRATG